MNVVFSDPAIARLREIEATLVERSPKKAKKVIALLIKKGRSLSFMSRRGRMVPEIGDEDTRELIVGDYRLIYEVNDDEKLVEILTIIHGRQDFPLAEFIDD